MTTTTSVPPTQPASVPLPTGLSRARQANYALEQFVLRGGPGALVGLLALSLSLLFLTTPTGRLWEAQTRDARFRARGERTTRAPIVIIAVDDETARRWDEPSVFWGAHYAAVLESAKRAGARAVALDSVPTVDADGYLEELGVDEATRPDTALARVLLDSAPDGSDADSAGGTDTGGTDTGGTDTGGTDTGGTDEGAIHSPFVLAFGLNPGGELLLPIARYRSLPAVQHAPGFIDLTPDTDGVVRTMPLWAQDAQDVREGGVRPAFATLAALRWAGVANGQAAWREADIRRALRTTFGVHEDVLKGANESTNKSAFADESAVADEPRLWTRLPIHWTGRRAFATIPAWRVESGQLRADERRLLDGALAFVGVVAQHSRDISRTPFGPMYGVALHAQIAATLLDKRPLRPWPVHMADALLLCALAGLLPLLMASRFGPRVHLPATLLLGAGIVAGAQVLFVARDTVLPLGGLLLCGLLPYAAQQVAMATEERVRRQQMRKLLGRSVSPAVRDYLLQDPRRLRITSGSEFDATILFFDIRGSLAFTELQTPTQTLAELNDFFARIVPILEAHGGLLYRYTGDGFLAVFGAPESLPDHAARALRAAVALVGAVALHNRERAAQNKTPLPVGCGLCSGPLVCGHLGIAERSDFTVIGEVVNRAARLEGANKTLGACIVVSRTTWDAVPAAARPTDFIGQVTVAIAGSGRGESVFFRRAEATKNVVSTDASS